MAYHLSLVSQKMHTLQNKYKFSMKHALAAVSICLAI